MVTWLSGLGSGKFDTGNTEDCAPNTFVEFFWRVASQDGAWSVEAGTKQPELVAEACACEELLLAIVSPPSVISLPLTGVLEEAVVTGAWVVTVVNDTVVEVCCSVVIMDGVENDNELVMEVLDGVKTEVTGRRYDLPERKWPEVPCAWCNSVLTSRFLKVALATNRDSVLV